MSRLGRTVVLLSLVSVSALAGLIATNSVLNEGAGGRRLRLGGAGRVAAELYHRARNTSQLLEKRMRSELGVLGQRLNATLQGGGRGEQRAWPQQEPQHAQAPQPLVGSGNQTHRDELVRPSGVTGQDGPSKLDDMGGGVGGGGRGREDWRLNATWQSVCAKGKDAPRSEDHPWPMYRLGDSSLGIRADFPFGKGGGLENKEFVQKFRFFLHEEGPFNMSDAEDCFRAKWKLPKRGALDPFEGLDRKMSHENRMYLLELFLWQSVREHPMRTRDPSQASLFVIGYTPIMLEWSQPCANIGDGNARQRAIHDTLSQNKWFKRRGGEDHLFLWTRYNLKPDKNLRSLLDSGPMVAVLERSFFMLQRKWPRAFEKGRVIMMPYVSSGFIDADIDPHRVARDQEYPHSRYFFRGNMKRHGEGLQREVVLPGLAKMLDKADFKHRKVNVGKDKPTVYTDLLNETASELRRASICPCPEGDSPTTLRPFEALAAGCLPFFMVEKEVTEGLRFIMVSFFFLSVASLLFLERLKLALSPSPTDLAPQIIAYDIPFPSLVDWDSIALFARSMQDIGSCPNGLQETFRVLDALGGPKASSEVAERLERMRQRGKEVFFRHFSFLRNPKGVVSSMLYEARELLQRGFAHNMYHPHLRLKVEHEPTQQEREKQMQHLKGVDVHSGDM